MFHLNSLDKMKYFRKKTSEPKKLGVDLVDGCIIGDESTGSEADSTYRNFRRTSF